MFITPGPRAVRLAILSAIAWGIPIPLKGYSFIASGSLFGLVRCHLLPWGVKNHTFFVTKRYSQMSMAIFCPAKGLLFL